MPGRSSKDDENVVAPESVQRYEHLATGAVLHSQALVIVHKFTRACRPHTHGKAEQFTQTWLREWACGWTQRNSEHCKQALACLQHHYRRHRPQSLDDRSIFSYHWRMLIATSTEHSEVRANIVAVGQRIMAVKGFSAVGINEILTAASVPKGSFYHYFGSKEAFGEALLSSYFEDYLAELDNTLGGIESTSAQRLMNYFESWKRTQSMLDCQGKCLAVKLGAEVADLSESMRTALKNGTSQIIFRLEAAIAAGQAEKSLFIEAAPSEVAESLYQLWVGASIMVKIKRSTQSFDVALATTRQILKLPG